MSTHTAARGGRGLDDFRARDEADELEDIAASQHREGDGGLLAEAEHGSVRAVLVDPVGSR